MGQYKPTVYIEEHDVIVCFLYSAQAVVTKDSDVQCSTNKKKVTHENFFPFFIILLPFVPFLTLDWGYVRLYPML